MLIAGFGSQSTGLPVKYVLLINVQSDFDILY